MVNNHPVIVDNITGEVEPLPLIKIARYRAKLETLQDIKKEMSRLYRDTRSGLVHVQDATKLTWCLQALSKVIESSDLEKRIEVLEGKK